MTQRVSIPRPDPDWDVLDVRASEQMSQDPCMSCGNAVGYERPHLSCVSGGRYVVLCAGCLCKRLCTLLAPRGSAERVLDADHDPLAREHRSPDSRMFPSDGYGDEWQRRAS